MPAGTEHRRRRIQIAVAVETISGPAAGAAPANTSYRYPVQQDSGNAHR